MLPKKNCAQIGAQFFFHVRVFENTHVPFTAACASLVISYRFLEIVNASELEISAKRYSHKQNFHTPDTEGAQAFSLKARTKRSGRSR